MWVLLRSRSRIFNLLSCYSRLVFHLALLLKRLLIFRIGDILNLIEVEGDSLTLWIQSCLSSIHSRAWIQKQWIVFYSWISLLNIFWNIKGIEWPVLNLELFLNGLLILFLLNWLLKLALRNLVRENKRRLARHALYLHSVNSLVLLR